MISTLPFEQRACFVAGQAKSGTTLLVALLDSHPELLVLPEETAYFPTVLTKYAPRGRRAQFDYLTKQSLSNVLFGGPCKWGKRSYATFPREKFLQAFELAAFDPANAQEDLLVLMVKAYAATLGRSLDAITRWVEKTPANRNHVSAIIDRFPHAKAVAVPERAKCARLSSAHAHQGRGAGRPGHGPQQRERNAALRLERLSRVARASGGALRSVRLQMGGAPRRSLPRGTGWVMRVKAPPSPSQAFAKSYGIICPSRTVSGVSKWHRVRTGRGTFGFRWSLAP